ncbi:MAG: DUF2520 domain-containing protein [Muribaculaceae bacterium]|nr:DUF2520 domain-containing protein [Muribaculaceae bacterium]
MKPRVVVIGQGNVAWHLLRALEPVAEVRHISSRQLHQLPTDAHYYILAVSDDAIAQLAATTPDVGVWAHTSGSIPLSALSQHKTSCGVFYPLQTLTKDVPVDWSHLPIFIEGTSASVSKQLQTLARSISDNVHQADSSQRRQLHIAAVMACNFANHLWDISDQLLRPLGVDFTAMVPLVQAMLSKATLIGPHDAQTGPARRGDTNVIQSHIESLPPDLAQIYSILSQHIIKEYEQD